VDGQLADAADATAVLRNWEQIKRVEKLKAASQKKDMGRVSGLDDIPRTMPAMLEAGKLGSRASKVGFDWPNSAGLFEKLQEEMAELHAEAEKSEVEHNLVEEELGDLLFTAVNLARHLKVDTESALRCANAKFRARFREMEAVAGGYDALALLGPSELDALWNRAKHAGDSAQRKGAQA